MTEKEKMLSGELYTVDDELRREFLDAKKMGFIYIIYNLIY